jgi:multimeric flavodoxin WrbA
MLVLGISASLRNKRFSYKNELVEDLKKLKNLDQLNSFVRKQIKITFSDIDEINQKKLTFEEKYKQLKKYKGNRGLSNSETALVYALWNSLQENNIEIDYLSLANIFEGENESQLNYFKKKFLSCDALLLSGPVYFGDRGSLTQRMIEYLNSDEECIRHAKKILYAGLAVGAKRNGGQETTLIFQALDFLNMGCKVIGNGHDTTAQYGGTLVAGDIGKAVEDEYGIKTALSTGQNLGQVLNNINLKDEKKINSLTKPHKCSIFILQDNDEEECSKILESLVKSYNDKNIQFKIFKVFNEDVHKCIACDVCPISYDTKDKYRCIINNKEDFFKKNHNKIIDCDSFIFAAYSGSNFMNIKTNYQQFIERTRYLRRDNYLFGRKLVTSFILSGVNSNRNLHIRIITSLIRHHNILFKPILIFKNANTYINLENMKKQFVEFCKTAMRVNNNTKNVEYKPVGYEISMDEHLSRKKN